MSEAKGPPVIWSTAMSSETLNREELSISLLTEDRMDMAWRNDVVTLLLYNMCIVF